MKLKLIDGTKVLYEADQKTSISVFKTLINKIPVVPSLDFYISKKGLNKITNISSE